MGSGSTRPAGGLEGDCVVELTLDEVRHIAILARIGMTDQDLLRFQQELSGILTHIQALQAVDTAGVEPTAGGGDLLNVRADDRRRPSQSREAVLKNAPDREEYLIKVRAVLE